MFKGSPHFFGALYFLVFKWALPFERIENGSIRFRGFIYVWLHQATSHLLLSKSLPTCAPTPMEMLPCAKCMYTLYSLMVYVLNVYVLVHKMGTVCIFPSPLPRSLGSLWDVSLMSRSRPQKSRGRHAASGTACKAATSSALWRSWPSGGQMMECPVKNLPPQRRYSWHFVRDSANWSSEQIRWWNDGGEFRPNFQQSDGLGIWLGAQNYPWQVGIALTPTSVVKGLEVLVYFIHSVELANISTSIILSINLHQLPKPEGHGDSAKPKLLNHQTVGDFWWLRFCYCSDRLIHEDYEHVTWWQFISCITWLVPRKAFERSNFGYTHWSYSIALVPKGNSSSNHWSSGASW